MNERSARASLGVSPSATTGEIKRAYRRRALELHPDRGGDPVAFARLADAQRLLLDRTESSRPAPPTDVGRPACSRHRRSWFVAPKDSVGAPRRRTADPARPASAKAPRVSGRQGATAASLKSFGEILAEKLAAA